MYGAGYDMYIAEDFISGEASKIGCSYDTSGYDIIDKSTHIFGDKAPEL